ncbi:hypothetical protein ACF09Y_09400 [Streptomyces massasporeus]|uniref:hypothetical protein n=1 Tax=Streptomyces massasporeus TaxID=67324 RepID=UPI0036FD6825
MTEEKRDLPARVDEVLGAAERLVHFLQAVSHSDPHSASQARKVIAQLDEMDRELKGNLVEAVFDRNRLSRRIAGASASERELLLLAAPFARTSDDAADLPPGVRDALRRVRRLRTDMAAWEVGVEEAEEVIRLCRDFEDLLRESRAGLQRTLDSLERRFRAAETKHALARLTDRLRIMDSTVRGALTEHVQDAEARAGAEHEVALNHEELRIRELYRLSEDAAVAEDLRRLRQDPS